MLTDITIENLAIVDRVHLRLDKGLNVLTGETGAGKSIIIDAVQAVLGGRCSPDMVRSGMPRAVIEAMFDTMPAGVLEELDALGFDPAEQLVLTREIYANGRSFARVNGRLATLSMLKEITRHLIDIHGQGEHQQLLDESRHLGLLDSFAGPDALSLRSHIGDLYQELQEAKREYARLSDARERARATDLLSFQIREIEDARLVDGEEQQISDERSILASAMRLLEAVNEAYSLVYEGRRSLPAIDQVQKAHSLVQEAQATDPRLKQAREALAQAAVWVDEAAGELRNYRDLMRPDPERLAWIEDRLAYIAQMKRKYGDSIEDILAYLSSARQQLAEMQRAEEKAMEISDRIAHLDREIATACEALSDIRRGAGAQISVAVTKELADLGMKDTRFEVSLYQTEDADGIEVAGKKVKLTSTGVDHAVFLLSPNPGEPLRPLIRIASGGEMSRVMLALKGVLARAEGIPTLIFDEIDAGVGGQVAYTLGEKLASLALQSQVLCVTHLAQIAAYADNHIVVEKRVTAERTVTGAGAVSDDDRTREVARMIGGTESRVSFDHAREMLTYAANRKSRATSES